MRLEQLVFVQEINKTKSMTAAAANLFVTPQYISKAIKQLEKELDITIFRRSKSGTFPTLKGEQVCVIVEDILQKINALDKIVDETMDNQYATNSQKLTIYLPQIINYLFLPLYQAFLRQYPETKFNIYQEESLALLLNAEKVEPDIFIIGQEKDQL